MIDRSTVDLFLQLVRLGVGTSSEALLPERSGWDFIEVIAKRHGLLGVFGRRARETVSNQTFVTYNMVALDSGGATGRGTLTSLMEFSM